MKCKHCGREIIRIRTMSGTAACDAAPITYWRHKGGSDAVGLITPNGIETYGALTGELQDAVGVAYHPHTCHQLLLVHLGRDSWSRPVYKCPTDGRLYVDVEPREDREPHICTKQSNAFDGEPCDPVPENALVTFIPHRDTW